MNKNKQQSFLRTVLSIALPVAAQSMLQSSFSMVDQLMVGRLGELGIAAVEVAGKPGFVLSFVLGAVATIAGIMISQYMGKHDDGKVSASLCVNGVVAAGIALVFAAVSALQAGRLCGIFTDDAAVVQTAAGYLRTIALSFVPGAVSAVLAVYVRCVGKARYPLYAGLFSAALNTLLNWLLIFGRCGAPQMGVQGAAVASVAASVANLLLMVMLFMRSRSGSVRWSLSLGPGGLRDYAIMLLPVVLNEFLWTVGQNVNTYVYGHIGTQQLAAMSLTGPVQGMFIGALSGLSQAAGILIGKRLGQKDYDAAYAESRRLCWYALAGSVALAAVLAAFALPYTRLFNVEPGVAVTARHLLFAFALLMPVKVLNMVLGGGIVRSGGKTTYIMAVDICGTWLVGVPLALLTAFVLKLDIVWVYFILSQEELVRLVITAFLFKSRRWMQTL